VFQRLDRVRQAARLRKKEKFTALMHLVDVELLRQSYFWLQKNAAAGADGITWHQYGEDLEQRLVDLHGRRGQRDKTTWRKPGDGMNTHLRQHYRPTRDRTPAWLRRLWLWL
jgi:hypothetical protein